MNESLSENVQAAVRVGDMVDTFYYGETNSEKQAYPCVVNNKFVQQFTNLGQGGGTSQFVISPYEGVSDIVLAFTMGAMTDSSGTALPQGWGYSLIRQVSVRYGSSAQYYFTGAQIYLQNLVDAEDAAKRDQLATLGGNTAVSTTAAGLTGAQAYVYLNLPHNSPRADGKPLPFPSDLLVQPIVITVELNAPSSVIVNNGAADLTGVANAVLSFGQMQVKQELMQDSADLLARRVDMNSHAYTFPLKYFPQQETQINLTASDVAQSVNLTGFRAGEVQKILLWMTKASNTTANGNLSWVPISNVVLTYNGEIFFRADNTSSQIWNLITDTKSAGVNDYVLATNAWAAHLSTWVDVPFAQVNVPYDKEVKLVHGKPILNAVVNLSLQTPTNAGDYVLHAVYLYNSSLLCSRGSAEYIF
jgi:hypothetical protein